MKFRTNLWKEGERMRLFSRLSSSPFQREKFCLNSFSCAAVHILYRKVAWIPHSLIGSNTAGCGRNKIEPHYQMFMKCKFCIKKHDKLPRNSWHQDREGMGMEQSFLKPSSFSCISSPLLLLLLLLDIAILCILCQRFENGRPVGAKRT